MTEILLCQPTYGMVAPESMEAAASAGDGLPIGVDVVRTRFTSSLLCYGFNQGVAKARQRGSDFYALLHADVAPSSNWLATMLEDLLANDLDVIHAPCAIKDYRGLTSTAVVREPDLNEVRRRLSIAEIQQLPEVFTAEDVQATIDSEAEILLPNTGCLLVKCGEWFKDWNGFTVMDAIQQTPEGGYNARCVPEDWLFGFDCYEIGLKVGGTRRVRTTHYGRLGFPSWVPFGQATDESYAMTNQENITCN